MKCAKKDINIKVYPLFRKEVKILAKRYRSILDDIDELIISLKENPTQGTDLGNGLRKVRLAISSKGKGKSGGARIITHTVILNEQEDEIGLLTIYDKSEKSTIKGKELSDIMKRNGIL